MRAALLSLLRKKEFLPELGLREQILYIMNQHMEGHYELAEHCVQRLTILFLSPCISYQYLGFFLHI